jgi:acetyl-CoA acyltransferase
MPEAVLIDCVRTPIGKAPRGVLRSARPDDMAAALIKALLERYPAVDANSIEDLVLGCAMPEAEAGMNMGRMAALRAGLPDSTPGCTVNRFCASGLESIAIAATRIRAGEASTLLAGGSESMSLIPMGGLKLAPNPWFVGERPEVYLPMGLTAERVQKAAGITREAADAFSLRSHQRAMAAAQAGHFQKELIPFATEETSLEDGKANMRRNLVSADEGPRADTSAEALAKLRPAFHVKGSVTAGNSSPTSDGAAMALLTSSDTAKQLGLQPLARFVSYAVAGVAPELMGLGPVAAIPMALRKAGLSLSDIGCIELNEAFAVQALAVIAQAGLNEDIVNVNGGAIALGHPLGATGARLTATLLHEMQRRQIRFGMVTMCVGGGQGAAGIFELLQ